MNRLATTTQTATLAMWMLATTLATTASLALAPLTDRARQLGVRARDDETGASDLVTVVLITAVAAAAVIAVWGIIETYVTNEANNLPSSGN